MKHTIEEYKHFLKIQSSFAYEVDNKIRLDGEMINEIVSELLNLLSENTVIEVIDRLSNLHNYKLYKGEYFENSELIFEFEAGDSTSALNMIRSIMTRLITIKHYYNNIWIDPDNNHILVIDYGSHSDFFYLHSEKPHNLSTTSAK